MLIKNLTVSKNVVLALLGAWSVVTTLSGWSHWITYTFFTRIVANDFTPDEDPVAIAESIDAFANGLFWAYVVSFLLCVIFFCIWTYRAARNAKHLSSFPQKISPGWAVGWYFVPFANFWKPFQGMREIWWRSAWPQRKSAPVILNIWWILWVGLSLVSNMVGRILRIDEPTVLATASAASAVISLLWILPAVLLMWIVDRVTKMQLAKSAANPAGDWVDEGEAPSGAVSAV